MATTRESRDAQLYKAYEEAWRRVLAADTGEALVRYRAARLAWQRARAETFSTPLVQESSCGEEDKINRTEGG
jgi:hypothetical protein